MTGNTPARANVVMGREGGGHWAAGTSAASVRAEWTGVPNPGMGVRAGGTGVRDGCAGVRTHRTCVRLK
jgi:hypothetical protein